MIQLPDRDQTIAIAAVFQSCRLVDEVARTGNVAPAHWSHTIRCLLEQSATSAEALFGPLSHLSLGLSTLQQLLTQRLSSSNTLRYVVGTLHLQRKLLHSPAVFGQVTAGISELGRQRRLDLFSDHTMVDKLAELYRQTLSTLPFRIQVHGEGGHLQQPVVASRIRCLLFAAIRAGVYWHYLGGRRWHLMFCRRQLLRHLQRIQAGIATEPTDLGGPAA